MRKSKALSKTRSGQVARICGLGHYIPSFIRHAAVYGYDCIWLDLEHRAFDDTQIQAILAFCHWADIDCMVRPPTTQKTRLYRYLEDGAAGLMIPHVSTPEMAEELVQSCKFPPLGNRGIDGAGLDCDFTHQSGMSYVEAANTETFLVVQIETQQAVENVEAIAAVEGVDGLFLGPGDLSLRLHYDASGLTLEQAQQKVADAAKANGKPWGRPAGDETTLDALIKQGAQLLAFGGDFMAIRNELEAGASTFSRLNA